MPYGLRVLRAPPFVPVSGAGRAALVALARLAAVHLAGSDGVRVGPWAVALLFGSPITSSFAADSFCKGLGAYCRGDTPVPLPRLPEAVAIVFERGENHPYKFFVEPVLWVFLVTQAHALVTQSNAAGAKAAPR